MARHELIPAKKEKAEQRVKSFRKEMAEFRIHFEALKGERQEAVRRCPPPPPPTSLKG